MAVLRIRSVLSIILTLVVMQTLLAESVSAQGYVYFADPGVGHILRLSVDAHSKTPAELIIALPPVDGSSVSALAIDELQGKIYWTDPSSLSIWRANLDGSSAPQAVLSSPTNPELKHPQGIAIDQARGYIFWGDSFDGKIYRANLDGSGTIPIVSAGAGCPFSIALHVAQGLLYWVDTQNNAVNRVNIGGGSPEPVLTPTSGFSVAGGLALNLTARQMYVSFLDNVSPTPAAFIGLSNLDGTNQQTIIPDLEFQNPSSLGLELAPSPTPSRVFWLNATGGGRVMRSDIGSPNPELVGISAEDPTYMVLSLPCSPTSLDSDGDGTPDCLDGCLIDNQKQTPGVCGCGVPDTDSDGDGTPDCNDLCPSDGQKIVPGACGCGATDTDSDGDGTLDCNDLCPIDPNKILPLSCGCGVADVDSDSDGTLDCNENCPSDPNKDSSGVCGCGVPDIDADGDDVLDCIEQCPGDPLKTSAGVCGCGFPDTDSDGDSVLDCNDQCPTDPFKTAPDRCGCSLYAQDSGKLGVQCLVEPASCLEDKDGDGTVDCSDQCPTDPEKTTPGVCGCEFYENENTPGSLNCEDDPLLAFETIIIAPPTVIVRGNDVTVILKKWSGVKQVLNAATSTVSSQFSTLELQTAAARTSRRPLKYRYDIRLKRIGGSTSPASQESVRKLTKRNQYTFRDLKPGRYSVKYRAQITRSKKVVDNTNFSPATQFEIF